ncbi:auxin-responsive protein SAUR71-like [Canna indica]|uniref:Auxin-responsive protein SAUR71-like n=1 Tax=Canna indica TaxID=4628 RepID=A0AAQ3Q538_9LILI|nr:auxin-responsive protein SAUR71-like [Canna indica]
MAKSGNGRLSKLKCIIKRWHSSSRLTRTAPSSAGGGAASSKSEAWHSTSFHGADEVPPGLHPVYVGRSRRRYLVSEELVGHPLFRVLVERSGGHDGGAAGTVIGCEVVLFEHLLWMLENAEPPPEALDELVEFYAC